MLRDISTILWKNWHDSDTSWRSSVLSFLFTMILVGVLFPLSSTSGPEGDCFRTPQSRISAEMQFVSTSLALPEVQFRPCPTYNWVTAPLTPVYWAVLPYFLLGIAGLNDSIAGERERHTLATLLASRLSDRAIFFGKVLDTVLRAWLMAQAAMFIAAITAFLRSQTFLFYRLDTIILASLIGLLLVIPFAIVGVLFSSYAASVKQARQRYGLFVFVVLVGPFMVSTILFSLFPGVQAFVSDLLTRIAAFGLNTSMCLTIVFVVLFTFNAAAFGLALKQFQRGKLTLD